MAAAPRQAPPAGMPVAGDASFTILYRGVRLGTEAVTLSRDGDGWRIFSAGHQNQPIDIETAQFEVTYGSDWSPRRLTLDALQRGQPVKLTTTFTGTSAVNDLSSADKTGKFTQDVSPHTIVVPNGFYGAYEALAARLTTMKVGDPVPLYVAPEGEIPAKLVSVADRHIATPTGRIDFREFNLTVSAAQPQPLRIWVDSANRLAEVAIPLSGITVARSDLATVMVREELVHNAGDDAVFVPMNGFEAGATVTTPKAAAANVRHPAVILVPGFGPEDRDEAAGGVPVYGLIAGALADAGYVAVRYDHRGIGQSGGRPESATLADYRDDLLQLLAWVRNRKDVDSKHVAVAAYGEGGAIAMLAAAKTDDIKGVALLGVPGTTGRDYVLEQQTRALAAMKISEADRANKVALEHRLIDATISGTGVEQLPAELIPAAEQPMFKSWLLFNPAKAIVKIDQPVLILQGAGDADLPRTHADALATAAHARKRPADATRVAVLPNVTHVLTSAGAATTIGFPPLSPDVTQTLTGWLRDVFAAK